MQLDFVEESYWKRCAAKKFAVDCSLVALNKAKLRVTKQIKRDYEEKKNSSLFEAIRVEKDRH